MVGLRDSGDQEGEVNLRRSRLVPRWATMSGVQLPDTYYLSHSYII